jgi:hypothetical protein
MKGGLVMKEILMGAICVLAGSCLYKKVYERGKKDAFTEMDAVIKTITETLSNVKKDEES